MHKRLFAADDLGPGEKRRVEIDGRGYLVVCTADGEFHALADICPHQGARLSDGFLSGAYVAPAVGEIDVTREGQVIRCPWHNFSFDVITGNCLLEPDRYRVKTYDVSVQDGDVVLEVSR